MRVQGPPSRVSPSALLIGALTGLLAYSAMFARGGLLVDDAFISFRYAVNLAEHGELVFNLGERVEGYSNFSWTLLLAALTKIGIRPPLAAPALGYGLGLLTLALTYRTARRALGCSPLSAGIAMAIPALNPSFTFWAGAGMESALFALLLLGLVQALWSDPARHRAGPTMLAAVAALTALTRPEGLALGLLVAGMAIALHREGWRRFVWPTVGFLAVVAVHVAWRRAYYGDWLPTSVFAKVGPSAAAGLRGARYLGGFLWHEGLLWLLPIAGFVQWRDARYWTLGAVIASYCAFVMVVGGDGLYGYRLPAHILPLFGLAVASGLDRLQRGARRILPAVVAGVAVVLAVCATRRDFFRNYSIAEVRSWEERWEQVGLAIARHTPPGSLLATNVVGRIPYFSRQPTLDLLGLTDRVVAHKPVAGLGDGYAGHERAAPAYVLGRRPAIIYFSVLDGLPEPGFRDLRVTHSVLAAGSLYRYAPLLEAAELEQEYAPAFVRLDDGRWAGLFVRIANRAWDREPDGLRISSWTESSPARASPDGTPPR